MLFSLPGVGVVSPVASTTQHPHPHPAYERLFSFYAFLFAFAFAFERLRDPALSLSSHTFFFLLQGVFLCRFIFPFSSGPCVCRPCCHIAPWISPEGERKIIPPRFPWPAAPVLGGTSPCRPLLLLRQPIHLTSVTDTPVIKYTTSLIPSRSPPRQRRAMRLQTPSATRPTISRPPTAFR